MGLRNEVDEMKREISNLKRRIKGKKVINHVVIET